VAAASSPSGRHGQQADRANLCSGLLLMRTLLKSLLDWLEYNHPTLLAGARGRAGPSRTPNPDRGRRRFLFYVIDGGGGRGG
jgi:hypothetical protein